MVRQELKDMGPRTRPKTDGGFREAAVVKSFGSLDYYIKNDKDVRDGMLEVRRRHRRKSRLGNAPLLGGSLGRYGRTILEGMTKGAGDCDGGLKKLNDARRQG